MKLIDAEAAVAAVLKSRRYEMVSMTRCGEAWQDLERDDEYGEWIHLDDIIEAIRSLPAQEPGQPWTREALATAMYEAFGRRHSTRPTPEPLVRERWLSIADIALSRPLAQEPKGVCVAEGRIDSKRCAVVDADDYALVWMLRGRFNALATARNGHRVRVWVEDLGDAP